MIADPWARRCPNGHTSLRHNSTASYYFCDSCDAYFRGEPVDARRVDGFPLDDADSSRIGHRPPAEITDHERRQR